LVNSSATISDHHLRFIGEALQQPRQRHFQLDVILRDIQMTGSRLPERTNAIVLAFGMQPWQSVKPWCAV